MGKYVLAVGLSVLGACGCQVRDYRTRMPIAEGHGSIVFDSRGVEDLERARNLEAYSRGIEVGDVNNVDELERISVALAVRADLDGDGFVSVDEAREIYSGINEAYKRSVEAEYDSGVFRKMKEVSLGRRGSFSGSIGR